jgi:short-subunit dehydrogenase
MHGIKAFLPHMLEHGEPAHVVNTGSLASFNGHGDHAPYCSSKAAVLGMSQSLYCEMKAMQTNIGVSIVCPGMVATRIHQSWRNRPAGDAPWSDREFANAEFMQRSNEFQGAGISPDAIAESTHDAILADRFYVFTGDRWQVILEATLGRAMRAENPFVMTWGEDRRPASERGWPPRSDAELATSGQSAGTEGGK